VPIVTHLRALGAMPDISLRSVTQHFIAQREDVLKELGVPASGGFEGLKLIA